LAKIAEKEDVKGESSDQFGKHLKRGVHEEYTNDSKARLSPDLHALRH